MVRFAAVDGCWPQASSRRSELDPRAHGPRTRPFEEHAGKVRIFPAPHTALAGIRSAIPQGTGTTQGTALTAWVKARFSYGLQCPNLKRNLYTVSVVTLSSGGRRATRRTTGPRRGGVSCLESPLLSKPRTSYWSHRKGDASWFNSPPPSRTSTWRAWRESSKRRRRNPSTRTSPTRTTVASSPCPRSRTSSASRNIPRASWAATASCLPSISVAASLSA